MKKAVILHGTDGSPNENWLPWLKTKLQDHGYEVWSPELPDKHTPNWETWGDFLLSSDWDFIDNVIVGHSAGAVEVLNLLMDERFPHVKLAVPAAAWAHGYPLGDWIESGQFDNTFWPGGFDFDVIRSKADKIAFVHGDNDPYCPLEQAEYLAKELQAPLTIIHNGEHLGDKFTELQQLWEIIEPEL